MTAGITLLTWGAGQAASDTTQVPDKRLGWAGGLLVGILVLGADIQPLPAAPTQADAENRTSLVVMTFNTQQFNDGEAEKSFDRQLAVIRRISPDILSLQESDSAKISLNNNDYVRYFAEQLGYYSYFGPRTVTGTYGTAILSKYPLENTRTVFTYSYIDEIGRAEGEIQVSARRRWECAWRLP